MGLIIIKQFRIFYAIENTELKLIHLFNNWEDLFIVVPQGSVIVVPQGLFNIYMCHLFLFMAQSDIVNYAYNTTLSACQKNLFDIQKKL